eukprot:358929-Chlamydomonas_euryale.AAC.2
MICGGCLPQGYLPLHMPVKCDARDAGAARTTLTWMLFGGPLSTTALSSLPAPIATSFAAMLAGSFAAAASCCADMRASSAARVMPAACSAEATAPPMPGSAQAECARRVGE